MRLAISFKVPKEYEKGFGKADKKTVQEFKRVMHEKLQPAFEKAIEEVKGGAKSGEV